MPPLFAFNWALPSAVPYVMAAGVAQVIAVVDLFTVSDTVAVVVL